MTVTGPYRSTSPSKCRRIAARLSSFVRSRTGGGLSAYGDCDQKMGIEPRSWTNEHVCLAPSRTHEMMNSVSTALATSPASLMPRRW